MDQQEELPLKQKPGRKTIGPYAISKGKNYFRDYYREHKEYTVCVCGSRVMKSYMCKHIKTKKHLSPPKIIEENEKQDATDI
jgi:hypothetical protein